VTIGGDGTFLYGARLAAPLGIPVMGVNRGRLGFLTDVEVADLPAALEAFAAGRCHTQRRSMLEASVPGDGHSPPWLTLALNEVAVKSSGVAVARIRVEQDGELLGDFDADGVVVATATGSTAYALSAGGPPIDPRVRAIVVVPLAPHAVISRAIVLPEMVTLRITVARGRVNVAADGHAEIRLRDGAEMIIRPGPELAFVRFDTSPSFLRRLREKVRFGLPLKELERPVLLRPADTDEGPPAAEARP
jgi:NAD+ kinase